MPYALFGRLYLEGHRYRVYTRKAVAVLVVLGRNGNTSSTNCGKYKLLEDPTSAVAGYSRAASRGLISVAPNWLQPAANHHAAYRLIYRRVALFRGRRYRRAGAVLTGAETPHQAYDTP